MTLEEQYDMRRKRLEEIIEMRESEIAEMDAELTAKDAELTAKDAELDAFNRLIPRLLEQNRTEDLKRASADMQYRKTLLEEFQLI